MTVSPEQILAAQAKGLINVVPLAKACDAHKFPFYLACAICDKETDGRNIFGHDKRKKPDGTYTTQGVAFSGPDNINIEVTEARYTEFLRLINSGSMSNGVGPMQLTYRGYHIGPESLTAKRLKAWVPADNMLYGVSLLAHDYKAQLAKGLSAEKAFWGAAKIFNGGSLNGPAGTDYANDAVVKARTWAATVGSSDMEVDVAERIPFRGLGLTCSCVVESLPWVEAAMIKRGIIKHSIDIKQLGYQGGVAASKGTHDRGGCVDVEQRSAAAIDVWRHWGWTMQDRSHWFPDEPHAHGWPYGCPHLSEVARGQNTSWDNRRNGLVNNEQVIGLWPVPKWDDAIERMVPTLYTETDIAKKVLTLDGIITNVFTGDAATNKQVTLKSAIEDIGREVNAARARGDENSKAIAAVNTKLDALVAAVKKLSEPPKP